MLGTLFQCANLDIRIKNKEAIEDLNDFRYLLGQIKRSSVVVNKASLFFVHDVADTDVTTSLNSFSSAEGVFQKKTYDGK